MSSPVPNSRSPQAALSPTPRWRRILLKMSGQVLSGAKGFGLDDAVLALLAEEIRQVHALGVSLAVVIGGGNFFRGKAAAPSSPFDRITADHIGMLATLINALALQGALERLGIETRVMSAFEVRAVCEPFLWRRALRHLEKGRVLLFAAGTGHPFFSTDTAAVLRAAQINAEVIFKGTHVDGVYDKDPNLFPDAFRFDRLTFQKALRLNLSVMDTTAFSLAADLSLPILVFNITHRGNLLRAVLGEPIGTLIDDG